MNSKQATTLGLLTVQSLSDLRMGLIIHNTQTTEREYNMTIQKDVTIKQAFKAIADHMVEERMEYNRDIGDYVKMNGHRFIQSSVLSKICYGLNDQLGYIEDGARNKYSLRILSNRAAQFAHTMGDNEIDREEFSRRISRVEEKSLELYSVKALFDAASNAYEDATGEQWAAPSTRKAAPSKPVNMDDLAKRAAALGIDGGTPTANTDGINTSDLEAADAS